MADDIIENEDLEESLGDNSFSKGKLDETNVIDNPEQVDALAEDSDDEDEVLQENREYYELVAHIEGAFRKAKDKRRFDEGRWIDSYRNYRGIYGPDVKFTDEEKSRAFIKITKTKVLAAYAKISEVLFSGNKFPIGVEETPVPEGVAEAVHIDPKSKEGEQQPEAEEERMPSTITRPDIWERVKPIKDTLERLKDTGAELKEGHGKTASSYTWEPAKAAAKKMEKKIHDQLEEANADKALRSFVFEQCLFGHGILKGPLATDKEYPRWDAEGAYNPKKRTVADLKFTSIWNNYPDPDARDGVEDCEYWIERHRMSRMDLRKLKKRPFFRSKSIDIAIDMGANWTAEYWEHILEDSNTDGPNETTRYEVLEFWGIVDHEFLENTPFAEELPEKYEELDQYSINAWVCNGQVLRVVLNPFEPVRIPYHACPYEVNPYSFWGVGIAENMMDTQLVMNGFFRLAIDNAVLSSNVIFEVDETNLAPGQDMTVYPGKIFRRTGGAPGQALFATTYPNVTNECMIMFDKARQLADESTGMPSYAHGMSGVMSTGRTAAGMSMLMGAADENIKSVVRNVDDFILVPLGRALYSFNMQFDFDPEVQGDLDVVAKGTESLMRNEIRSQKLLQFLQLTTNEADMPFVKRDYILRELAESLDLESEKVVNDPREAAIQAEMIKNMRSAMGIPPEQEMGQGQGGSVPGLGGPEGTGSMGGGTPPPGGEGFTAPDPTQQAATGTQAAQQRVANQ